MLQQTRGGGDILEMNELALEPFDSNLYYSVIIELFHNLVHFYIKKKERKHTNYYMKK